MDVDLIFKIAAVGIIVAVINILLNRTGREDQALMVTLAARHGYQDNFMGAGERRIRFTGHGVGLELDEYPFIAKGQQLTLQAGMVIALEPKTIFPGSGVVGIENTHLITADGLEPLTVFPDQICVLQGGRADS